MQAQPETIDQQSAPLVRAIIFASDLVQIGMFRCRPWYAHFEDTGPISANLIVFPRTSVRITHAGGEPIIANPNVIMFYNQHQVYRRGRLSERGDLCEFFAFSPELLADALDRYDPLAAKHLEHPFQFSHSPSEPHSYLLQRLAVEHVLASAPPDRLFVEETMLQVLMRVVAHAYQVRGVRPRYGLASTHRAHAAMAREAQALISTRFHESLSLADLAAELYTSPHHLCRVFQQQTGYSIHRYQNHLRLCTALEYVAQGCTDLTDLALALGYSSHSHFTQAFRQIFGVPPSSLRRPDMSKILIA
jgi:AraC-like DNA-binding protein